MPRVCRSRTATRNARLPRQRSKRRVRRVGRCRAKCSRRRVSAPAPLPARSLRRPERREPCRRAIGSSFQYSVMLSVSSRRSTRLRCSANSGIAVRWRSVGCPPPRLGRPPRQLIYSNLGTDGPRPRGPSGRQTWIGDKGPTSGLVPSKPRLHRREVSSGGVGGERISAPAASVADHVERFSRPGGGTSGSHRPQNQLRHCPAADHS
jgi:hypothetical protein